MQSKVDLANCRTWHRYCERLTIQNMFSVGFRRREEIQLKHTQNSFLTLHFDCSEIQARTVFLILQKKSMWEDRLNLWLRETFAIRGNSLGKGRGTELGKDTIYWPLTHISSLLRNLNRQKLLPRKKKKENNAESLCSMTSLFSFFTFLYVFRKRNQNETSSFKS